MQRYFAKDYDDKLILRDSDIHHIKNVMRMNIGDSIEIVYDRVIYRCVVDNLDPFSFIINDKIVDDYGINFDITIVVGLVKEQKFDLILQKLTELGVSRIIPVNMERSIVKLDDKKLEKKYIRWNTICKEASEQCKRSDIPIIDRVMNISDLANVDGDIRLISSIRERDKLLDYYLQNIDNYAKIVVVIGPEGGMSDKEEDTLISYGYLPVSLGNLIFRVETACMYVASILNFYSSRGV